MTGLLFHATLATFGNWYTEAKHMYDQNIASSTSSFKSQTRSKTNGSDDAAAAIKSIARRLYGAKQRCGPNAKPSDKRHYRGIAFDFPNVAEGAAALFDKLGPLLPGELTPSEQFLPEEEKRKLLRQRGHSIDRIDPRGPYAFHNIHWSDAPAQTANRVLRKRIVWASAGPGTDAQRESAYGERDGREGHHLPVKASGP